MGKGKKKLHPKKDGSSAVTVDGRFAGSVPSGKAKGDGNKESLELGTPHSAVGEAEAGLPADVVWEQYSRLSADALRRIGVTVSQDPIWEDEANELFAMADELEALQEKQRVDDEAVKEKRYDLILDENYGETVEGYFGEDAGPAGSVQQPEPPKHWRYAPDDGPAICVGCTEQTGSPVGWMDCDGVNQDYYDSQGFLTMMNAVQVHVADAEEYAKGLSEDDFVLEVARNRDYGFPQYNEELSTYNHGVLTVLNHADVFLSQDVDRGKMYDALVPRLLLNEKTKVAESDDEIVFTFSRDDTPRAVSVPQGTVVFPQRHFTPRQRQQEMFQAGMADAISELWALRSVRNER